MTDMAIIMLEVTFILLFMYHPYDYVFMRNKYDYGSELTDTYQPVEVVRLIKNYCLQL